MHTRTWARRSMNVPPGIILLRVYTVGDYLLKCILIVRQVSLIDRVLFIHDLRKTYTLPIIGDIQMCLSLYNYYNLKMMCYQST
jgi:hypothetical protein